ncbi:MAG: transglutaminase-like domain-containing protein [Bacteroidia bacterium]
MTPAELKALINLLDDPDEEVYTHVKERLIDLGDEVIPLLENVWEMGDPFNNVVQTRIENIIHDIQFSSIKKALVNWAKNESDDLLKGIILVAKYQYPDLDEKNIYRKIDQIIQDVWIEFNDNLTGIEKVKVINHILFDVHGFSGNTTNYHAPQNSFINNVLESKKGNPLSLAILYAVIAHRLDLPIYGVNLPEHFILAYVADNEVLRLITQSDNEYGVLFYINPFSRGAAFSKKEIDAFLAQLKLKPKDSYFKPCTNIDIIKRTLNNLIFSYEKLGYPQKSEELSQLLKAISNFE